MGKHAAISTILNSALKMNEEKRQFTRISLQAKVSMLVDDQVIEGDLVNISLQGAFVTSDRLIEINTSMTITIFDTPTSRVISDVKAKVVRVMGNGVGLRFDT
jgi:hypothetical protein